MVATLIKLSGVGVSLGFQFGSATFAGLFGCQVVALVSLLARRGRRRLPVRRVVAIGVLGLVAVEFIGNLDALRQLLTINGQITQSFDFWQSTRVIAFTINEFPYFSELWADLHPHVINFALIAFLLTLLTHLTLDARAPAWRWSDQWPWAVAAALTLGSLGVTNSWDAPLAIVLTCGACLYAGLTRSRRAALGGLAFGGGIAVLSFAAFWPFYRDFYSVVSGVHRTSAGSELSQFLIVWGIFGAIVALAVMAGLLAHPLDADALRDGVLFLLISGLCGGLTLLAAWVLVVAGHPRQTLLADVLATTLVALAAARWRVTTYAPGTAGATDRPGSRGRIGRAVPTSGDARAGVGLRGRARRCACLAPTVVSDTVGFRRAGRTRHLHDRIYLRR